MLPVTDKSIATEDSTQLMLNKIADTNITICYTMKIGICLCSNIILLLKKNAEKLRISKGECHFNALLMSNFIILPLSECSAAGR